MKRRVLLPFLTLPFLGICTLSCQKEAAIRPGRALVSGSVSYQGSPLPGGEVSVGLASNPMVRGSAMIDENGQFTFLDAPIGLVKVTVRTSDLKIEQPDRFVAIPDKYANPEKSGLQVDVKAGENEPLVLRLE